MSDNLNKTRYTHRDYQSIKSDLINAIPSLTQEWTSTEDTDPGIVLIKLISMFGDTLSYNVDKIALELYIRTVTQRKNCSKILNLLGYKMHWYRAAKVEASVRLQDDNDGVNPYRSILTPFTTVFRGGDTSYVMIPSNELSGTEKDKVEVSSDITPVKVKLVEGRSVKVEFNKDSIVDNRYYFAETNVDESILKLPLF